MSSVKDLSERIKKAEERLAQLKAKKTQVEARQKAALSKRSRAEETRRKILVGAMMLSAAERDESVRRDLFARLKRHLIRHDDRALFDLDKNTTPPPPPPASSSDQDPDNDNDIHFYPDSDDIHSLA